MVEKHFIEIEDDEIAAVHHKSKGEKWIFFCHGFGSDKEGSYELRAKRAVEEGFNAVRFDFRGNGESSGDFIEQTLGSRIKDLEAVIDYFGPAKCVVFGSSFGGKVAFHTAIQDDRINTVIGRAPVTYNETMEKYHAVVKEKGEFTHHEGATIDDRFFDDFRQRRFGEVENILDVPVAIFHGSADTTVHVEHSLNAAKTLDTELLLHKLEGEKHKFSSSAEEKMQELMFTWLENTV